MWEDYGDYAPEIDTYLRSMELEQKRMPRADYLETVQTEVTAFMRAILVDWLASLVDEFWFVPDTIYRTVSYIDRFLSFNPITMKRLQLLGVSSMLIASKFEELKRATASQFSDSTNCTYTPQEVVAMERCILKTLDYEVGNPTVKTFLRRFIRVGREDVKYSKLLLEFLANYLAELTLLDYGCVGFLPSTVAASAVFLARFTVNPKRHPWNKQLEKFSEYAASDLKDCVTAIHDLQLNKKGFPLMSIREKYKDHTFKCVASLRSPQEIPALYFDDPKEEEEEEEEDEVNKEEKEEKEEEDEDDDGDDDYDYDYDDDDDDDDDDEYKEYEEYEEGYEEEEEINLPPSK